MFFYFLTYSLFLFLILPSQLQLYAPFHIEGDRQNDRVRDLFATLSFCYRALNMVKKEQEQVGDVQHLLNDAYCNWQKMWGKSRCTYNTHHLAHLQMYYDLLGPLADWSALPFESAYSILREKRLQSRNKCKQILTNMYIKYTVKAQQRHPR